MIDTKTYKALSIVTPMGDKIASGEKTIEVRSWLPPEVPLKDIVIIQNKNFLYTDGDEDEEGTIVALVDFNFIEPWHKDQVRAACSSGFKSK